jgi:hypothetical protein
MNEKIVVDHSKISHAGQHLLNIFYALIILIGFLICMFLLLFFKIKTYDEIIYLIGIIEGIVIIILLSNLYSSGKKLKNSALIKMRNKMTPVSDKIEYEEYINRIKQKEFKTNEILVEEICPACKGIINDKNKECPSCGLIFN